MKRPFIASGIAIALTFLGACSYAPKPDQAAAADYGRPMTASEMERAGDAWLLRALKDPESRRVEWGPSGRAWYWHGIVGGGHKFGYATLASVNAKNSFGGYTGSKPYFFFFRDGQLVTAHEYYSSDVCGLVE